MAINKSLIGTIAGALVAAIVTWGAIKLSNDSTIVENAAPTVENVIVSPADPNKAAVRIEAPAGVRVGELAVLDVSESNANSFTWRVVPETKNFMVIDDGRRAVFSSETGGEYLFIVSAAKGDTVDCQIHKIQVAGPGTPATPTTTDVGAKVPNWVAKVQSPNKRDEALKLAQSFSSIAAIINPAMSAQDIVNATIRSNRDALGASIKNWEPFLVELQVELEARAADGSLSDADSHVRMWRSISAALTRAAETTPTSTKVATSVRGR